MGTRKDLRERFRVRMGFPEDTATGNGRFNAALNSALRHLWGDLPDVILPEEFRFHTEPPFDGGTVQPYYGDDIEGVTVKTPWSWFATKLPARFPIVRSCVAAGWKSMMGRAITFVASKSISPRTILLTAGERERL